MTLGPIPDDCRYDYEGMCWWCGATADSREHKWKKSEIKGLYGPPGSESYPLMRFSDGEKPRQIQGPDSALMKFEKSLCQNCNNAKSQPFDLAYDDWVAYIDAHYDEIVETRFINITDVSDGDPETFRFNVARYYAKHIGCRVADRAGEVPQTLIAFLNGSTDNSSFAWTELCLSESALAVHHLTRAMLGMPATVANYDPERKTLTSLKGALMHGAFQLVWDINLDPQRPDGATGILPSGSSTLRVIGDDLYSHRFPIA